MNHAMNANRNQVPCDITQEPDSLESRLTRAMESYLAKIETGVPFDREAFLSQHADLEPRLSAAIESIDFLNGCVSPHDDLDNPTQNQTIQINAETEQLGDYRLIREIGRGGMGVVYEAEQISLKRRVALKVLPFAALLDRSRIARFQNEAQAAAMLKHAHIVGVFSVGCDRGIHYYAMELIDGQSMSDLIRDLRARPKNTGSSANQQPGSDTTPIAQLSTNYSSDRKSFFRSATRLFVEVCDALHFAHQRGVIHRDIKPSNLLLDHAGKMHITDFGLARIQSSEDLTVTGDVVGTLRYMSPEQLDGRCVDERADVYSLGVTLYEVITGRHAFDAELREALTKQVFEATPTRPSRIDSTIPKDLDTIIMKAIAKDPNDRYRDAVQFGSDLKRFLDGKPVSAKNPNSLEIARRWVARNRVVTSLAATVMTLLFAFAVSSAMTASHMAKESAAKEIQLYGQSMRLANNAIRRGDFVTAEEILINWRPAKGQPDHRGWEWSYLWNASHDTSIERTFRFPFCCISAKFVDDHRLATSSLFGSLSIWDLNRQAHDSPLHKPRIEGVYEIIPIPDQNRCVTTGSVSGRICELDLTTGEQIYEAQLDLPTNEAEIKSLAISSDQTHIAVGLGTNGQGHVGVWNRLEQEWVFLSDDFSDVCYVEFGDGDLVYVAEWQTNRLTAIDFTTQSVIETLEVDVHEIHGLAVSADRTQLIIVGNMVRGKSTIPRVLVWDLQAKQAVCSITTGESPLHEVAVSHDGSMLAVGDTNGTIHVLDAGTLDTLLSKKAHAGRVRDLSFSGDSLLLVSAGRDGDARIWNIGRLRNEQHARAAFDGSFRFGFGAGFVDNTTAISVDRGARAIFWDIKTGDSIKILQLPFTDSNIHQLAVSHDQRLAAVTHGHSGRQRACLGRVSLIDAEAKTIRWSVELDSGIAYTVSSFSHDNRLLAVSADQQVLILDVQSGSVVQHLDPGEKDGYFKPATFSPDGKWLACGTTSGNLYMYRLPSFDLHRVIRDIKVCDDVQFAPDMREMAVVDLDNRIKLFSPKTGEQLPDRFPKMTDFMFFVRYSPDGKRLLTGGHDGMLRIWQRESGTELLSLEMATGYIPAGNFSPDGNSIVVANGPETIAFTGADMKKLRMLSKSELEEVACAPVSGEFQRRFANEKERQ
ncbi:MAG: protein kinase [Planctomycetales bacterium]|nr:protein kinase [Planctomycetales bacterium]